MKERPFLKTLRMETTLRPELAIRLTPQMQLRLEILQANILTLEEMISLELEQNPALETVEPDSEKQEETAEEETSTEETPEEALSAKEFSIDDFYPGSPSAVYGESLEPPEPAMPFAARSSLEEHMLRLIVNAFSDTEQDYRIAHYILNNLDDDGFFSAETERIARELGTHPEQVEKIRNRIQRFEPVGVASVDVREALLVQLRVSGYEEQSHEVRILEECFDSLLQRRITSICHKLRISSEAAARAFEAIAALDPKPGRNFRERPRQTVQPDLTIRYREGKLQVSVNESPLPSLRLSRRVREILENPKRFSSEETEFARRKLEGAQLFIKGILQRRDTLSRMTQEILNRNYDFFSGRTNQSASLLMKDIADALGLHSSTISRAVRDKYIETPVGIFPLRNFFLKSETNPMLDKLKGLITGEDKNNPLTDAALAERLGEAGINVSRRTVAKYRLKLNIPDLLQRKALG